jgi:hypothetical protein
MLPSHAGGGAAEVTWPRRNVETESCWQQGSRVMLATVLSCTADDGTVKLTLAEA